MPINYAEEVKFTFLGKICKRQERQEKKGEKK
jgi:hypothetical protein